MHSHTISMITYHAFQFTFKRYMLISYNDSSHSEQDLHPRTERPHTGKSSKTLRNHQYIVVVSAEPVRHDGPEICMRSTEIDESTDKDSWFFFRIPIRPEQHRNKTYTVITTAIELLITTDHDAYYQVSLISPFQNCKEFDDMSNVL